jgi:hypothetical protein
MVFITALPANPVASPPESSIGKKDDEGSDEGEGGAKGIPKRA